MKSILVVENQNLFYIYALMNIAGYDDDNNYPMHEIRLKVREDLQKYKDNPIVEEFKKLQKGISLTWYWLTYISFMSEDNFVNHKPNSEDAKNIYYKKSLKAIPLVLDFVKEANLERYYQNEIRSEYKKINKDLQKDLNRVNIFEILENFWGLKLDLGGKVILNPLNAAFRSSAGRNDDYIFSVNGPNSYNKQKGRIEFSIDGLIPSIFHEYSHLYVEEIQKKVQHKINLSKEAEKLAYKKILKGLNKEQRKIIDSNYNYIYSYINETFVRAAESMFLTPIYENSKYSRIRTSYFTYRAMSNHLSDGFYVDVVADLIKNGRVENKCMEEMYIDVVSNFVNLTKKKDEFRL